MSARPRVRLACLSPVAFPAVRWTFYRSSADGAALTLYRRGVGVMEFVRTSPGMYTDKYGFGSYRLASALPGGAQ